MLLTTFNIYKWVVLNTREMDGRCSFSFELLKPKPTDLCVRLSASTCPGCFTANHSSLTDERTCFVAKKNCVIHPGQHMLDVVVQVIFFCTVGAPAKQSCRNALIRFTLSVFRCVTTRLRHAMKQLVKALRYKPEGRRFDSR